ATVVSTGGVVSLFTVTITGALVVWLAAASQAIAVNVWLPIAAALVFHEIEYGAAVTSAPRAAPSSANCTPTTPTLSLAVAVTGIVPDTVVPAPGASMEIAGAVTSRVV